MNYIVLLLFFVALFWANEQYSRQDTFTAIDDPEIYSAKGTAILQFETDRTKQVLFREDYASVQGLEVLVYLSSTERLAQKGTEIEMTTAPVQDDTGGEDTGDAIATAKKNDMPQSAIRSNMGDVITQPMQAAVLWVGAQLGALQDTACAALSVPDNKLAQVRIFPNPVSNYSTIASSLEKIDIQLSNPLQRRMLAQTGRQTIDLFSLNIERILYNY